MPCGYAPRALHRAADRKALFVGSKDGSISVVTPKGDGYESSFVRQGSDSGVRALSEWQSGWLWVGRRNGEVELIDVSAPASAPSRVQKLPGGSTLGSVRALGFVDRERCFISFQKGGTWIFRHQRIDPDKPGMTLQDAVAKRRTLRVNGKKLCGLLLMVPFKGRDGKYFVTVDSRGQVFVWEGDGDDVQKVDPWSNRQRPGFVNDYSILYSYQDREIARGVLLATDRGVHLLHPSGRAGKLACRPLNFPGLGAVCMAITCVEPKEGDLCYLWAADSRGDGHLFTSTQTADPTRLSFFPSGHFHAGSQSMMATSWYRSDKSFLVICQVRRNDQIVVTEYRDAAAGRVELQLLHHGDETRIGQYLAEPDQAGWPSYAKLAELFERLAEKHDTLEILLEFLGDPSATAAWSILQNLPQVEERRTAVQLWTLSLVGVINRAGGKLKESQRESAYLGIVRWLSRLLDKVASTRGFERLVNELETSIRMVRKWGLFGEANARQDNLIRPLTALREQHSPDQFLDRLTYETLLFERGIALRVEDRGRARSGRNAWDLSGLTLWESERYHFAVSWHWGLVEIYEVSQEDYSEPKLIKKFPPEGVSSDQDEAPTQYGHSRAVLLGKLSEGGRERAYLLTAPAWPHDDQTYETVEVRELRDGIDDKAVPYEIKLPQRESLYSLLDLGSGWVLAGLSGGNGNLCLLGRVTEGEDGSLVLAWQDEEPVKVPRPDATDRLNRVWCLARIEPPSPGALPDALLGCEDGSIYRLKIRPDGSMESAPTRVARMSSAVSALVCRRIGSDALLRIVAGGVDGSIVAWQELKEDGKYASLWAADEGEQIAGLHLLDIPEAKGGRSPMVLGITRDERFVLLNDCETIVADRDFGLRPQRIPVPGCRHGTFQRLRRERASAFATCLVPDDVLRPEKGGTGRVALMLTASKHGVLRLLSLHYPHFQSLRKQKFESILKDWWTVVQENHQLRLVHAAYRTAPSLELILVRWLLDLACPKDAQPGDSLEPWMLPRNLRPLLTLKEAWERSYSALQPDDRSEEIYNSLLAALREAFRLEDLLLYQEICEVVLQRGNWELFTQAAKPEDPRSQRTTKIYLSLFKAIEDSLQQWRGGVNREESLARMNVARNMVDGDTAFRLCEAVAGNGTAEHFHKVLERRIGGVRDLVIKGGATARLEALRAANLSLLRLCKRLVDRKMEILWEGGFEPYFSELAAAAARILRSPFKHGDVVEHGYARAFALAVCACPSAALRIATRLTETRLISNLDTEDDLGHLILKQFQVLGQIGIKVPDHAQKLFEIGARRPKQKLDPLQDLWLAEKGKGRTDDREPPIHLWQELGAENARDLACLWRLHAFVNWFSRLETIFLRQPEDLIGAWGKLVPLFGDLCDPDVKALYRHSFDFWCAAVQRFACTLLEKEVVEWRRADEGACEVLLDELVAKMGQGEARDPLQPKTVLFSRKVAAWAADASTELNRRYQQLEIFQPEYRIFGEVLLRVERSAQEFPNSAAVRMNLVQGVLGHHLLEDLDEHLLELQEIAHVLDPELVRQYREGRQHDALPNEPVAQRFARYLMTRSIRAESLPENLRTLFSLLSPDRSKEEIRRTLGDLLEYLQWQVDVNEVGSEYKIGGEALRHLDLILKELDLNAEKHPPHPGSEGDRCSPVSVKARSLAGGRLQIEIWFRFPTTDQERREFDRLKAGEFPAGSEPEENLGRLWVLKGRSLQGPIRPRLDRAVASSGVGLYVANFAAAIVLWELGIAHVDHDGSQGECVFTLTELEKSEGEGDESAS